MISFGQEVSNPTSSKVPDTTSKDSGAMMKSAHGKQDPERDGHKAKDRESRRDREYEHAHGYDSKRECDRKDHELDGNCDHWHNCPSGKDRGSKCIRTPEEQTSSKECCVHSSMHSPRSKWAQHRSRSRSCPREHRGSSECVPLPPPPNMTSTPIPHRQ